VLALTVAGLLAACSFIPSPEGDPGGDPSGTGPGRADVFMLVVGDCFDEVDESDGEPVDDVPQVDCAAPHDYEIYDSFDLEGDEYPGHDEANATADEGCLAAFEPFIGLDYDSSAYDFSHLVPTAESWRSGGDREVLCLVFDPAGKTSGSLQGAAS
jgi:hypothetical protein